MTETVEMEARPPCTSAYLAKSCKAMYGLLKELVTYHDGRDVSELDFIGWMPLADLETKNADWFAETVFRLGYAIYSASLRTSDYSDWSYTLRRMREPSIGNMVIMSDAMVGKRYREGVGLLTSKDRELYQNQVNRLKAGKDLAPHAPDGGPPLMSTRWCITNLDGTEQAWGNCQTIAIPMWREIEMALRIKKEVGGREIPLQYPELFQDIHVPPVYTIPEEYEND